MIDYIHLSAGLVNLGLLLLWRTYRTSYLLERNKVYKAERDIYLLKEKLIRYENDISDL